MIKVRKDEENILDEIVANNCKLHLERVDKKDWQLVIYSHDGQGVSVEFRGCKTVIAINTSAAELPLERKSGTCPSCKGMGHIQKDGIYSPCMTCYGNGHV